MFSSIIPKGRNLVFNGGGLGMSTMYRTAKEYALCIVGPFLIKPSGVHSNPLRLALLNMPTFLSHSCTKAC